MLRLLGKIWLCLTVLGLAWFGIRALVRALVSPETRIRWVVEDMIEGFNDARVRPVLAGIAPEFTDRTSAITREDLRSVLVWMFLNETDDQHAFLWSATFDPASLALQVAEDERSAQASCRVSFFRRRGAESELAWDAHVAGTIAKGDDGWQWTSVTEANHSERRR